MPIAQDQNFDGLMERFQKNIYATAKGDWRLKLLQEDLQFLAVQQPPLSIWDAGCGLAQMSYWLAQQGHQLTLCDISAKMLAQAQQKFAQGGLQANFLHTAAQSAAAQLPQFDLVLVHAVLEWMAEPFPSLATILQQVKPGGYLSLLFYNRNVTIYIQTIKGGGRWQQVLQEGYLGKSRRLVPPNPLYPYEVIAQLEQAGFKLVTQTGIRVFYDFIAKETLAHADLTDLFELEYRHCRLPTFRDMGRYVHVVAQRVLAEHPNE